MKIKSWIIKKLGGVTEESHERARSDYEKWAIENLTGKNGEVTPGCAHHFPREDEDITIIRSRIGISSGKIKRLKVAPWCRRVVTSGLRVEP